jgi:flagellin FlaB
MLSKLMKLHKNQKGITGLETAIILIAFVVVASVFAYTVLSAGLFSTQKSQEAVYNGLAETQSTMQIQGGVTAYAANVGSDSTNSLTKVQFMVSLSSATGEQIDLAPTAIWDGNALTIDGTSSPTQIAYTDSTTTIPNMAWTIDWVGKNDGNNILNGTEKALITVWLHDYDGSDWSDGTSPLLAAGRVATYHTFTLEVKPSKGAVLNITRTTPAVLNTVTDLH